MRWMRWVVAIGLLAAVVAGWAALGGLGGRGMSEEEARARIDALAERFDAALQNERDRTALRAEIVTLVDDWPELAAGRQLRGQAYLDADEVYAAADDLEAALSMMGPDTPGRAALCVLAGSALESAGRLEEALRRYHEASLLEPGVAMHPLRVGNALAKLGRDDEADRAIDAALNLDATLFRAHLLRAELLRRLGDVPAELTEWERALSAISREDDTDSVAARREVAVALSRRLMELRRPVDAARVVRGLDDTALFSAAPLAALAEALNGSGLTLEAARYYELWLDGRPDEATAAAEAARWYLEAGAPQRAAAMLVKLRNIDAGDGRLALLSERLREQGQP